MKTPEQLCLDVADAKAAITAHHAEHSLWLAKAEVLAQNLAKAEAALPGVDTSEGTRGYLAAQVASADARSSNRAQR
jgi:hypothetical protein